MKKQKTARMRLSGLQPSQTEPHPNVRFDGAEAGCELCVLVIRGALWEALGEPTELSVRVALPAAK